MKRRTSEKIGGCCECVKEEEAGDSLTPGGTAEKNGFKYYLGMAWNPTPPRTNIL